MGIIKKGLMIAGSKSMRKCEVLFDTGASACFVKEDVASELGEILKAPFPLSFKLSDNTILKATKTTDLFVDIKGHNLSFFTLWFLNFPMKSLSVPISSRNGR